MSAPWGVVAGSGFNLFVADKGNSRVDTFTLGGNSSGRSART